MSTSASIPKWLYDECCSGFFCMIPPDILESKNFQGLSYAAKIFYITLNIHKNTKRQRDLLYKTLDEYNRIFDLGMSEDRLEDEALPNRKTKYTSGYFVAPETHMKEYGYSKSYQSKLKRELIKKGFIRIKWGGKGKYSAWDKNVTVYQFITSFWHENREQTEKSSTPQETV